MQEYSEVCLKIPTVFTRLFNCIRARSEQFNIADAVQVEHRGLATHPLFVRRIGTGTAGQCLVYV